MVFQVLIGILKTGYSDALTRRSYKFQVLIGILKTKNIGGMPILRLMVSSPYRYSKN